ncbi:hypothetical protein JCM1841_004933 [Sporobolomyces salmonicolor]
MDVDKDDVQGSSDAGEREPWESTRAGKRIAELNAVEENIAVLLHFAGRALASLHPDPMSSFTTQELEDQEAASTDKKPEREDKAADFAQYAESYYETLNDIQFGLRTSIRHLRVSRTSPAPLLDPSFGSLATSGGPQPSQVGVGGAALAELLKPLELSAPTWDGKIGRSSEPEQGKDEQRTGKLSVAAKELEREAWKELADALEGGRRD